MVDIHESMSKRLISLKGDWKVIAQNGIFTAVGSRRSALDYVPCTPADLSFHSRGQAPVQRQHSSSASTAGRVLFLFSEFLL